jgi:hypothetical protein
MAEYMSGLDKPALDCDDKEFGSDEENEGSDGEFNDAEKKGGGGGEMKTRPAGPPGMCERKKHKKHVCLFRERERLQERTNEQMNRTTTKPIETKTLRCALHSMNRERHFLLYIPHLGDRI